MTIFILSLVYFLLPAETHAASTVLAWDDHNTPSRITGYYLYQWEDGVKRKKRSNIDRNASCPQGESPKTKCFTVHDLEWGKTYHFEVAVRYDNGTKESEPSKRFTHIFQAPDPTDLDDDGLTDQQELALGTDPYHADSDGDGLSDHIEVNQHHTDPLSADSDGDGFSDGDEVTAGVDPTDPKDDPDFASSVSSNRVDLIFDNSDAVLDGRWVRSTGRSGYYGTEYQWATPGKKEATATWEAELPQDGDYDVYAWWAAGNKRVTDAPYTIHFDGGSETVEADQTRDGGKWVLLGTYPFAAGTAGRVVLSNDATGKFVCADAVRFELVR